MKIKRQSKILELINSYDIETQEELAEKLEESGIAVTQGTISRDIRELKLTKILMDDGQQKYAIMAGVDQHINDRLIRVFKDAFVSMDYAQNILVIKTCVGMGMAVGTALDSMNLNEVIGTIAGEDTVFCVVKSEQKTLALMDKLRNTVDMLD